MKNVLIALSLALVTPLAASSQGYCPWQISGGGISGVWMGQRSMIGLNPEYNPFDSASPLFVRTWFGTYFLQGGGAIEIRCGAYGVWI